VDQLAHTENPLAAELIDVICSEGMVDRDRVTLDAMIEDLDLKSVDIIIILTAIEEKYDVYIPMDGSLQEAKTVRDLINALARRVQHERR
jgi:acyl carrier protein